jgi:hypothetical protein
MTRTRHGGFTLESIDDYLGPATGRFFGSGYRRVRYRIADLTLATDADTPRLGATVAIWYPDNWSTKAKAQPIRPHLSTIDALILGARMSSLALTALPGLDEESRRAAWLRRVDIKASATPTEEGLEALPVTAELRSTCADGGQAASVVACRVGPMTVQCELVHAMSTTTAPRPGIEELIETTQDGPYGMTLHEKWQHIEQVQVIPDGQAEALVSVARPEAPSPAPLVSMVDAFVVSLQLGQVLLYELDGVERARSNTLWMRSTRLTSDGPYKATEGPFPASASLADPRLLKARGATWRTASIVGECLGIRTHCAVAHEVPDAGQVSSASAA